MISLSMIRGLAVASVLGAMSAVGACGGGTTGGATGADAGNTNGDAAIVTPDASGDDSSSLGDAGGIADVGADIQQDPNTYPAMHHPLPQVDRGAGTLLDQMEIVQVTFGTDANLATYTAFDNAIGGTMWWQQALMPYGISPAVVSATVALPDTVSGTTVTDAQVQSYLAAEIASGALPEPDAETLYVVYAPRTFSVSLDFGTSTESSCNYFDGYHSSFPIAVPSTTDGGTPTGLSASYAMVFNCGYGGLEEIEVTASHEIGEAATDPHPDATTSTYYMHSDDAWEQVFAGLGPGSGAEVADLCNGDPWSEGTYYFNKIYSNSAAALSKNPCQPDTNIFFGAAIDTTKAISYGYLSDGFVTVSPGSSTDVVINFFSDAALPSDPTLTVGAPNSYYGGGLTSIVGGVTATLSQTTAHNGDGIILTIAADPSTVAGNYLFVVRSTLTSSNFNDWAAELRVE
jgi:hypothetical protein